jgi:hypothetical protein
VALGAQRLSGDAFKAAIVGRPMDEGSWTWAVNADGTHGSSAKDGSWKDEGGKWKMKGDQYCRNTVEKPKFNCSFAYMIGPYLRMGPKNGELAGWTVKVQ